MIFNCSICKNKVKCASKLDVIFVNYEGKVLQICLFCHDKIQTKLMENNNGRKND